MDEVDIYICEAIRTWVWSGFYSRDVLQQRAEEMAEDEGVYEHVERYLTLLDTELENKRTLERKWPDLTDCDRLEQAFDRLNGQGIVALHNAGFTQSEGLYEVGQELHERAVDEHLGYCFYHEQDVANALDGSGLHFSFGDFDDIGDQKHRVARAVMQELNSAGFAIEWDGNTQTRLYIPRFEWMKRLQVQ